LSAASTVCCLVSFSIALFEINLLWLLYARKTHTIDANVRKIVILEQKSGNYINITALENVLQKIVQDLNSPERNSEEMD